MTHVAWYYVTVFVAGFLAAGVALVVVGALVAMWLRHGVGVDDDDR